MPNEIGRNPPPKIYTGVGSSSTAKPASQTSPVQSQPSPQKQSPVQTSSYSAGSPSSSSSARPKGFSEAEAAGFGAMSQGIFGSRPPTPTVVERSPTPEAPEEEGVSLGRTYGISDVAIGLCNQVQAHAGEDLLVFHPIDQMSIPGRTQHTQNGICNSIAVKWLDINVAHFGDAWSGTVGFSEALNHDMGSMIQRQDTLMGGIDATRREAANISAQAQSLTRDLEATSAVKASYLSKNESVPADVSARLAHLEQAANNLAAHANQNAGRRNQLLAQLDGNLPLQQVHVQNMEGQGPAQNAQAIANQIGQAGPGLYTLSLDRGPGTPGHILCVSNSEEGVKVMDPNTAEFCLADLDSLPRTLQTHFEIPEYQTYTRCRLKHLSPEAMQSLS